MNRLRIRYFKYLFFLFFLPLLSAFYSNFTEIPEPLKTSTHINAQGEYPSFIPKGDIRRFAGETLIYDIDFLFFEKAATAKERTVHFLDYTSRTRFWFFFSGEELKDQNSDPIPEGVIFDDILAFFYNFRNEVYGDLKKGGTYKIDTVPENSMKSITTYISTEKEAEQFRIKEKRAKNGEMLLKVLIPKDVFKTETGELVFWASNHYTSRNHD